MGQSHTLQKCLFFSLLHLTSCSRAVREDCKDYGVWFERVFSVPGEANMLNCTLVAPEWFDFQGVPYNVSWYGPRTQGQLGRNTERTLAQGTALWFFSTELEDSGAYVCVVRTPSQCFRQTTYLLVNQTNPGCDQPYRFPQTLTNVVNDQLICPYDYLISKVDSIQWYKGCEPIEDGEGKFTYLNGGWRLKVAGVKPEDRGFYTCTISFVLAGVPSKISATVDCDVKEEYVLQPLLVEPSNDIVTATLGSSFSKACRVFVPCVGKQFVDVMWSVSKPDGIEEVSDDDTQRVYSESEPERRQEEGERGVWLECWLKISAVEEEDFDANYTCRVESFRGILEAQFTLLPADPNLLLPVGLLLVGLGLLFTAAVIIYHHFKIHIVLLFRSTFPFFYKTIDSDGKLYDAYVAYPRPFGGGAGGGAEMFALHTLPKVLEGRCGYKLFIFGRDSLPGEAVVDVVEKSMQASRRLLLLYSASTFGGGGGGGDVAEAGKERYEREAAMHRALQEGSLRVVLVELEEVSPAQLVLFPHSVRHLRERQGAVCLWKNRRTRGTRGRPGGGGLAGVEGERLEAEMGLGTLSLSPSSRFWKELRYHMPVRGKWASHSKKNSAEAELLTDVEKQPLSQRTQGWISSR